MTSRPSKSGSNDRPRGLMSTKSFSRFEPANSPLTSPRNRASTIHTPQKSQDIYPSTERESKRHASDVFEKRISVDEGDRSPTIERSQSLPERFDELPIELASLTDRFVDSLTAKVWPEPPTIEALSDLFQEFYVKAGSHISTHISTLASRLHRDDSPKAKPTKGSNPTKPGSLSSKASKDSLDSLQKSQHDQQMLTASEVTQRRKARRLLELKRVALEEAVERRACEKIYDKIWRHKSTLDEVRDEKLRSKQAALALVGIGLKDLGIDIGEQPENGEDTIREWLAPAREGLAQMDKAQYPLAKLEHLQAAHKSIVETLSKFHPSSSSADEILPTMIFTLITSPPEGINIISNLYFIERFRASSKVDGEAAYCMTNLEAAISFLENVDLSSLRADEAPEGPPKSASRPTTPLTDRPETFSNPPPSMPPLSSNPSTSTSGSVASAASLKPPSHTSPSPLRSPEHQRRPSNPFQFPGKVIGAANDAVRNTAEEGFKNISNTLDNSFKLLFGRLKEHIEDNSNVDVIVPKTLDDARRLVSPTQPDIEEGGNISESSSVADTPIDEPDMKASTKAEEKILGLIGGRKATVTRDRSADSTQSSGSGKRVAFAASGSPSHLGSSTPSNNPAANALDSMKTLGSTLNPLTHLSAFGGGLRGFGGSKPSTPPLLTASQEKEKSKLGLSATTVSGTLSTAVEISKHIPDSIKFEPPLQKFVDIKNFRELKLGDVPELLLDYQRLAEVLAEIRNAT